MTDKSKCINKTFYTLRDLIEDISHCNNLSNKKSALIVSKLLRKNTINLYEPPWLFGEMFDVNLSERLAILANQETFNIPLRKSSPMEHSKDFHSDFATIAFKRHEIESALKKMNIRHSQKQPLADDHRNLRNHVYSLKTSFSIGEICTILTGRDRDYTAYKLFPNPTDFDIYLSLLEDVVTHGFLKGKILNNESFSCEAKLLNSDITAWCESINLIWPFSANHSPKENLYAGNLLDSNINHHEVIRQLTERVKELEKENESLRQLSTRYDESSGLLFPYSTPKLTAMRDTAIELWKNHTPGKEKPTQKKVAYTICQKLDLPIQNDGDPPRLAKELATAIRPSSHQ